MKLGEALTLRSELRRRVDDLRDRLGASVEGGGGDGEDAQALLAELEATLGQHARVVAQINRTNLAKRLESGDSLTDALARRDALDLHHGTLAGLLGRRRGAAGGSGLGELHPNGDGHPALDLTELRRRMDALARERRELDVVIQMANWGTDLVD